MKAVAVAPDGGWLATASDDGTARIWDPASGQERAVLTGHKRAVNAVAIAPDGNWLATGSRDRTARIWDPASGQERAVLTGHKRAVNAVAVAPDGSWLATGSRDQTSRIWDPSTGQEQAALAGPQMTALGAWLEGIWLTAFAEPPGQVNAVAAGPDGSWLAVGSDDGKVRIWNLATKELLTTLTGNTGRVNTVAVAADGRWLAVGSAGIARVWETATWQPGALMRIDEAVVSCAWLDSSALVLAGAAGLYAFDFTAGAAPTTSR